MDNDVYMAAYGEWKSRGLTEETMVYLTVSTGISASIISKGEFFRGAGLAGEIGLTLFHEDRGMKSLEELASGLALQRRAEGEYSTAELFAEKNHPELIHRAAIYIARGLHQIFCLVDPHLIVVGGGVINHQPNFF